MRLMPDKLNPIDLGKTNSPGKAQEKFYKHILEKKSRGELDADVVLSGSDLLAVLKEEFESDFRSVDKYNGITKFLDFGRNVKEGRIYLTYAGEDIAYFSVKEADELGVFLLSFNDKENEINKEEFNQFLEENLNTVMTNEELNRVKESIYGVVDPKEKHKKDKKSYKIQERYAEKANDAFERTLVSKANLLAETVEGVVLELQDVRMTKYIEKCKRSLLKLGDLTRKLIDGDDDGVEIDEKQIQSDLFFTICEIKYFFTVFEVSGNVFQKKTVDFDREMEPLLRGLGFNPRGLNKSVWNDKKVKATIKYIAALDESALPGSSPAEKRRVDKVIEKFEKTYPELIYTGVLPPVDGTKDRKVSSASKSRGATVKSGVTGPSSRLDPHGEATISTYTNKIDLGPIGATKRIDIVETDGIEIHMGPDGAPFSVVDIAKLTPGKLVEGYMREKDKAETDGATRRAKNGLWNYSFGIMDQIFEHPEDRDVLLKGLGGKEGIAGGRKELREIMDRVFFDTDFQLQLKNSFWKLKRDMEENRLPPEFGMYRPDSVAEHEDALREIAFTRALPDKFKVHRKYFERFTKGDHVNDMPTHQKVLGFLNSMGISDVATFVKDSFKDSTIDLSKRPSLRESTSESGISQAGGMVDNAYYQLTDALEKSSMIPEQLKGATKKLLKGGAWATKGAVKLAPLAFMVVGGVNGIKTVFKTVGAVFSRPPDGKTRLGNVSGTFRDGIFGKRTDGSKTIFGRNHIGGVMAPALAWLGIKTLDKAPGTQDLWDTGAAIFDDDAKARLDARKQINAVEYDRETHSVANGVKNTIGTMTLKDLESRGILYADEKKGKTFADISKLSDNELKGYLPGYNFRADANKMNILRDKMGELLRDEYKISSKVLDDLTTLYPNTTLNDLMARFIKHEKSPSMGVSNVLPKTLYSDEEYNRMNYLPDDKFEQKAEQLSFIGQQWNKLNNPALLDKYIGGGFGRTLPAGVDHVGYLSHIKSSVDKHGITFESWSHDHLKKLAQLDPGTPDEPLLEAYFKALYSATGNVNILVSGPPKGVLTSNWFFGPDMHKGVGGFFHDPDIGNGSSGLPYYESPTIGASGDYDKSGIESVGLNRDVSGTQTWDSL